MLKQECMFTVKSDHSSRNKPAHAYTRRTFFEAMYLYYCLREFETKKILEKKRVKHTLAVFSIMFPLLQMTLMPARTRSSITKMDPFSSLALKKHPHNLIVPLTWVKPRKVSDTDLSDLNLNHRAFPFHL